MGTEITGGCKCGTVRYKGVIADTPMFRCYCRDCQKLTGTGHSEMLPLVAKTFFSEGRVTEYRMTGGSGRSTWSSFCPYCGSPISRRSERMNHLVYVHAASLDEPERYKPVQSIYPDAAQPWDRPVP
ncbi:GFA family protein [Sulfitobacter sp. JBTF-M27]|uniref:GFA family protein n=2 Tax=Sulfitobacter sediminilitoris TaxID=2698830 RepID=A0A6P0CI98_9RHOB|nr:GFA family protein [Sulfitobacter sediminilitoris]